MYRAMVLVLAAASWLTASASMAQLIEGYNPPAAVYQFFAPAPQTLNCNNDSCLVDTAGTAHVTEGTNSAKFTGTWNVPGETGSTNYYESGGPLLFWAVRAHNANLIYNVDTTQTLKADLYNNSSYPVKMALYAYDGGFERGPLIELPGNAATTYVWKLPEDITGWISGNGAWDMPTVALRGFFVYTTTEPTNSSIDIDMDNIRMEPYSGVGDWPLY